MSFKIEKFGKYLLLEKLAAGGMAEVYLAKSAGANGINKFVAIKRILPQFSNNQDFIDMFHEEAKVSVNLNNSNVVSIFDYGIQQGQFYIVMEFVEGRNLRQIINELKKNNRSVKIEEAVYIIKEAAGGLDHAHRCVDQHTGRPLNITHRDMSPQNIMVSFEGEIKVIDFGIAKKSESSGEETKAGTLKGKFAYMSPEQAEAEEVDPRTDIFALGIILWELLANDRLFTGSNENAVLRKVRECNPPAIRKVNPIVPLELDRIVSKALAKDKNIRYQTAANLQKDLNRFLNTQYPDFSAQEFSKSIIDCFKQSYFEGREKLIQYAKIEMKSSYENKESTLTSTQTSANNAVNTHSNENHNENDKLPPVPFQLPPIPKSVKNNESKSIDSDNDEDDAKLQLNRVEFNPQYTKPTELPGIKNLKTNLIAENAGLNKGKVNSNTAFHQLPGYSSSTQTQNHFQNSKFAAGETNVGFNTKLTQPTYLKNNKVYNKTKQSPQSSDIFLKLFIVIIMAFAGFYGFNHLQNEKQNSLALNKKNEELKKLDQSSESPQNNLSKLTIQVSIQSEPNKARVLIDGVDTDQFTPVVISIDANQKQKISLKKDGYYDYEIQKSLKNAESFFATLQPTPSAGTLNISVQNGGLNPIVYINDQRLSETPPIKGYRYPASDLVKVKAVNGLTQVEDEQYVRVFPGKPTNVELILRPKITPTSETTKDL